MAYIRLIRYSGDPNRRIKTDYMSNYNGTVLGYKGDIRFGTIKTPYDVVHPVITIESDIGFPWNYLNIEGLEHEYGVRDRYYFIKNVTCLNNKLYEIECVEDVLTTFGDIINDYGYGLVDRNEFEFNDFITDKRRLVELGQDVIETYLPNDIFNAGRLGIASTGVWVCSGMYVGHEKQDLPGG